ncbi:uncharacterized protein PG998_004380 [Apiospora kogelbergensis]|uniref:uncharacterized protein n=1 Tax=Apiospora kogelbergensis TaxID=1337665 RepID=UPI00312FF853
MTSRIKDYPDITTIEGAWGPREDSSVHTECSRCRNLWHLEIYLEVVIYRSRDELVRGLAEGCWFCQNLDSQGYLTLSSDPKHKDAFHTVKRRPVGVRSFPTVIQYTLRGENTEDDEDFVTGFEMWNDENVKPCIPQDSTRSLQSWLYLTQRIQNCYSHHSLCQRSSTWVPTRLVEICLADEQQDGGHRSPQGMASLPPAWEETQAIRLRVVETSKGLRSSSYATLSHRWGHNITLKLTTANLAEYTSSVPTRLLPQTYRDAAAVARRLGVNYIWIDSLCIIQDSREDWSIESSTMGKVYENGVCNIAASSASDGTQGLFFERKGNLVFPATASFQNGELAAQKMGFYTQSQKDTFAGLDRKPLNTRGWVVQERLLAARNISFTDTCIFYECAEEMGCEIGMPHNFPYLRGPGIRYKHGSQMHPGERLPDSIRSLQPSSQWLQWTNIVEYYKWARLTFPADRLVAISGLAKHFQPHFGGRYLAGLWQHNLHKGLAWRPQEDWMLDLYKDRLAGSQLAVSAKVWSAPSWSWAAMERPSCYVDDHSAKRYYSLIEYIDAEIVPDGPDDYGMLKKACLHLKSYLLAVRPQDLKEEAGSKTVHFDVETKFLKGRVQFDGGSNTEMKMYYVMPLFYYFGITDKSRSFVVPSLLLESVSSSPNVFRRVGWIDMTTREPYSEEEKTPSLMQGVLQLLAKEYTLPQGVIPEEDRRYTIELV